MNVLFSYLSDSDNFRLSFSLREPSVRFSMDGSEEKGKVRRAVRCIIVNLCYSCRHFLSPNGRVCGFSFGPLLETPAVEEGWSKVNEVFGKSPLLMFCIFGG